MRSDAQKFAAAVKQKLGDTPVQAMTPETKAAAGKVASRWRLASTTRGSGEGVRRCFASTVSRSLRRRPPLPTYVSLAAVVGCLFLVVLYLSQRRDLARLADWMERGPEPPGRGPGAQRGAARPGRGRVRGDPRTSRKARLSRPQRSAPLVGPPLPPAPATPAGGGGRRRHLGDQPSGRPWSGSRPSGLPFSLTPRWRRLVAQREPAAGPRPRRPAAVVLGIAAIFGSERLLRDSGPSGPSRKPGAVVPARRQRRGSERHLGPGPGGQGRRRRAGERLQARHGQQQPHAVRPDGGDVRAGPAEGRQEGRARPRGEAGAADRSPDRAGRPAAPTWW